MRSIALLLVVVVSCAAGCGGGGGNDSQQGSLPTATAPEPTATVDVAQAFAVGNERDGGVILRSNDNGLHWSIASTSPNRLSGVDFVDNAQGWVVGISEILHTTDGGDSWTSQLGHVTDVGGVPHLSRVAFSAPGRGLAVGTLLVHTGDFGPPLILLTTDGGAQWARASIAPGQNPAIERATLHDVCVTSAGIGIAVGDGVSGPLVLLSADAGATWMDGTARLGTALPVGLSGVACVGAAELWIVGGGPARLAHSRDGGATWTNETGNVPQPVVGVLLGIVFVDQQTGWIAGVGPAVWHTSDGGTTWIQQSLPGAADRTASAAARISFANALIGGTVGTDETNIFAITSIAFMTVDGGVSWMPASIPSSVITLNDISAIEQPNEHGR